MSIATQVNKRFAEIAKNLKKQNNKKNMQKLALLMLNIVKERTRAGYGVKNPGKSDATGKRFKFPRLSDSYIEQRIRNNRKLSRFAHISKPNNTFTGKMLSDMKANATNSAFSLSFRSAKSREKAQFLEAMGREFMHLSKKEVSILVKAYGNLLKPKKL